MKGYAGKQQPTENLEAWLAGRVPDGWFISPAEITLDSDEILVRGALTPPEYPKDAGEAAKTTADEARIQRFREETREQRMRIAGEAERLFGRKVSWGASSGDTARTFTSMSVPVMTRLGIRERKVLDTLVEAGVARSRSHALAWCVRLVEQHSGEWLGELREALTAVEKARSQGPSVG